MSGIRLFSCCVLFGVFFSLTFARPKNSNGVQKDLYMRQILPAIPGYIPVYIQHGEEPQAWKSTQVKQKIKVKTHVSKGEQKKDGETALTNKSHDKIRNANRQVESSKFSTKQMHGRERAEKSSK